MLLKSLGWFLKTANYFYGFDLRNLKYRWVGWLPKFKYIKPEKVVLVKDFVLSGTAEKPETVKMLKVRAEKEMKAQKQLYGVFTKGWQKKVWVTSPLIGDFKKYRLVVVGEVREWK